MRTLLFIFISLIVHVCLYGNEDFKHLSVVDGLVHTDANCLAQDSTGLIWIGTYAGLQSYDGYQLCFFDYYPSGQRFFQSHNRITVMSCSKNKLWLGTESGLTCFDLGTYRYIPYVVETDKKVADFNMPVYQVSVHSAENCLWVGNAHGMTVLSVNNDTIRPLQWNSEEERVFAKGLANLQFQEETIWASTSHSIVQLRIKEGKVCIVDTYTVQDLFGKEENIQEIKLQNDFLYIRVKRGCYRVSVMGKEVNRFTLDYVDFHTVKADIPEHTNGKFVVDKNGTLWCAYWSGLFEMRYPFSESPSIRRYFDDSRDGQSVQKIGNLMVDNYNNLWVATNSWGVFYRALSESYFKNVSESDFRALGFSKNEIVSVTGQQNGLIWMLVEYGSLFCYEPQSDKLSLVPLPKDKLLGVYLQDIEMSRDQRHLYIGTNRGVFIYDIVTKQLRGLTEGTLSDVWKTDTSIADLREDEWGRLWLGTWGSGVFCVNNPFTAPELAFQLNTETDPCLLSNQITYMLFDGRAVYLCTVNGLNRIVLTGEGKIKTFSAYQMSEDKPASLSSNYLASIDCYNDSVCWIGTIGGGLNKVVLHSDKDNDYTATRYTTQDGLVSNDCEIVLVDNAGNVWIGANGISQLNIRKNEIYTYDFADGLQDNAFKINVSYKAEDGTFYMGGLYGLSYFNPDYPIRNANEHALKFTDLFVNNRRIMSGEIYDGSVILNRILDETSELNLNYLQNYITISVAALGYDLSEQIMYRYRLKGILDDWQLLGYANNNIHFSYLPYGSYELEVQLSADRGYTWYEPGKRMKIHITPPWWISRWAKIGYVLVIILIAILAFRRYAQEQSLKKENEIQKILIAQDEEKYQAKMQFFMNVSHELKTPLTLILLAVEKLINESKPGKECKSILYNVKRMLALISELVDIRKLDLGLSTLNLGWVNMSQMTRRLFDDMSSWAENKHIAISYDAEEHDVEMDADKEKIAKMILNLFSNAIKYTHEGGKIEISFKRGMWKDISPCYDTIHVEGSIPSDMPVCILTVRDTGIGISSDSIHLIYERFFQVNGKSQSHLGSGIGLAIVKSVVLQHKGMIVVSSERMQGSEFIIALPICENYRNSAATGENQMQDVGSFIDEQYNEFEPEKGRCRSEVEMSVDNPDMPTLLIVEDNKELQSALKERLSASYNIHIADNGREGLEKCMSIFPDIIISDVMMPEMDGIEMCRRVKNNLSVGSIPLVLLTAKDMVENQIEGYESGADLYIGKPFSMKLLEVNIHRLLVQREQLLRCRADRGIPEPCGENLELSETQLDEKVGKENTNKCHTEDQRVLMEKLESVIAQNISDPNLSPEQLSSALGVSRSKLYRELKGIEGYSLSDYVRNVRLEKAAYLLTNSNLNIQEIMTEVGFINSSHFTKVFKLKYNMTPSEYKRNA